VRTTVTLDPDTELIIRRRMRERGLSFKEALNEAIRSSTGDQPGRAKAFRTKTASLGISAVSLDRALQLAGLLEDDELVGKLRAGS
jgi:hypothetical protein